MAGCSDYGCNCLVKGGEGIAVSGSGTPESPYTVELLGGVSDALQVQDSPTVNFTLNGGGTPANPYVLSAAVTLALTQLSDVADPSGGPNVGDSPVWVGTGPSAHWEFQPPPVSPAGSTNVSVGLLGTGAIGDPIKVNLVSETPGSTSGLAVYVDTNGDLRAAQPVAGAVDWDDIVDKPTSFPTTPADFTGVLTAAKGGTGQNDLALVTVGNATKVNGVRVYVQSTTPTGMSTNDLWFWGA